MGHANLFTSISHTNQSKDTGVPILPLFILADAGFRKLRGDLFLINREARHEVEGFVILIYAS